METSMDCWEFMKCGREKGGAQAATLGVCPAWPDGGTKCAMIAGTLCNGEITGSFAKKIGICMDCKFFNSSNYNHSSE
jgi:hypothetical protein